MAGPIDSQAFQQARLRSEKIRIIGIIASLGALAVFIGLRLAWLRMETNLQDWLVLSTLFAVALGYEGIILGRLSRALKSGKDPGFRTWVFNVFIETLFPTIALIVSITLGYTGPYLALVAPTVPIYFVFIILSTLHVEPLLSLLTGISAAVGYLAVAVYVLLYIPQQA